MSRAPPPEGNDRIRHCARLLLDQDPDPVPRLRILRDLLGRDPVDRDLCEAKKQALSSRWVRELAAEQQANGGWPRFHSMDSRAKRKVATTEAGVRRALALGLEPTDEILRGAQGYLVGLLNGVLQWPEDEGKETNDRWPAGEEMFIASTLAMIAPRHRSLGEVQRKWHQIAEGAFASGSYDPEKEWRAHCRFTGATTMRNSYLVLNNRYAMLILGCSDQLRTQTERALLDWVWNHPKGLGYLGVPLSTPVTGLRPKRLWRWFESHWILSRFASWHRWAGAVCQALWADQGPDDLWDFGSQADSRALRLSENWRRPKDRTIDHSVWVLLLLQRHYSGAALRERRSERAKSPSAEAG